MPEIIRSVQFDAPPEQVWQTITDFNRYGDWMAIHASFPDGPPASTQPGTEYKEKVKIMGMPGDVRWTVTECEENKRLAMEGKGPMGTSMKARYELVPDDGGTRLDAASEFGGAALGPMVKQLEKESGKALDESMERLKNLVAQQPA